MAHFLKFVVDQDAFDSNRSIQQILRGIVKNENDLRNSINRFIIYLTTKNFKPSECSI